MTAASVDQAQGRGPTLRESRSLAVNVRRSAMWSMGSTILLKVANIAVTAIIARILGQHDFGVYAVATTVFAIVSAIGEFGVGAVMLRADLPLSDVAPTMWTASLGTSLTVAALLVSFAEPIAASLGSPEGAGPVRLMAVVMILIGVGAVPAAQCMREFQQHKLVLANVISFTPATVVLLVLAKSGDGAMSFAWSRVVAQATSCIVILFLVPKYYRPGMTRNALSVLFRFGLPIAITNFIGFLLQNVDYALIGRLLGPVMLGTYVVAFNVASWSSSLLLGPLNAVVITGFSRVKDDPDRLTRVMIDGIRAVMLVAAPMCALEMVLARPLILTLYGAKWTAGIRPLEIMTIYGLISIVCVLFARMLAALGRSKPILIVQITWILILVPAMMIGVHVDGIVGAAIAHILVIVPIILPGYLIALKRATGVRISKLVMAALPALIVTVTAGAITWLVMSMSNTPLIQLIIGGTAGGIFYFAVAMPQIILIIGRGKIRHPIILRVLRYYYIIGRNLGLKVGPMPRHARLRNTRRPIARQIGRDRFSPY